jgi:hypothetical protein
MQNLKPDFDREGRSIIGLQFLIGAFLALMGRRRWLGLITRALLVAVGVRVF